MRLVTTYGAPSQRGRTTSIVIYQFATFSRNRNAVQGSTGYGVRVTEIVASYKMTGKISTHFLSAALTARTTIWPATSLIETTVTRSPRLHISAFVSVGLQKRTNVIIVGC